MTTSAVHKLQNYLKLENIDLGSPVPENEIQKFEKILQVQIPNDFRDYLKTGAGSNGMHKKTRLTLHTWDTGTAGSIKLYRFLRRTKWKLFSPSEFEEMSGLFCDFADHLLFSSTYVLLLLPGESRENPVFWYPYDGNITKVADSFTHFIEEWCSTGNDYFMPMGAGKSIAVKLKATLQIDGTSV